MSPNFEKTVVTHATIMPRKVTFCPRCGICGVVTAPVNLRILKQFRAICSLGAKIGRLERILPLRRKGRMAHRQVSRSVTQKGGGQASVEGTYGLFQDVLTYELSCAERYRRFVSLVMVKGRAADGPVRRALADRIRSSDLLAEKNSHLVILMSETDRVGAQIAIERYRQFGADSPLWFSLVTFPQDTGNADSLVRTGERRLQRASESAPGEIISSG